MITQQSFDVIIIGAGPAGYSCAIRCAQLGLKTLCIDDWRDTQGKANLGGAFLNAGCVGSLSLLDSAKLYDSLKQDLNKHGIYADNIRIDILQMMQKKQDLIAKFGAKVSELFEQYQIQESVIIVKQ